MAIKLNNLFQRFDDSFSGSYSKNWRQSQKWFDILYNIMNLYEWTENSRIVRVDDGGNINLTYYTKNQVKPQIDFSNIYPTNIHGYFNITDSIVLQIKCRYDSSGNGNSFLDARILTYDENHNYTKIIADVWYQNSTTLSNFYDICFDTTNKGVAIKLDAKSNTNDSSTVLNNLLMFNAFVGDCTTVTGEKRKGIILFNEISYADNSKNIITVISGDDNVSVDSYQFISNYNTNRKAVFIPIVNRLNGDIFKDIYMMRYTPIQYNTLEMNDNKQYICGASVCLAD